VYDGQGYLRRVKGRVSVNKKNEKALHPSKIESKKKGGGRVPCSIAKKGQKRKVSEPHKYKS
jgi:hypothetical protein